MIVAKIGLTLPKFPPQSHWNLERYDNDIGPAHITVREAIDDLNYDNPRSDSNRDNPKHLRPSHVAEPTGYAAELSANRRMIENHATGYGPLQGQPGLEKHTAAEWDNPSKTIRATLGTGWPCKHPGTHFLCYMFNHGLLK